MPFIGTTPAQGFASSVNKQSFTAKYLLAGNPQMAMEQADMAAKAGLLNHLNAENAPMEITKREQHGDYIYSTATLKK